MIGTHIIDCQVTVSVPPPSCVVTGRRTTLASWDGSSWSSTRTGWRDTPSGCATTWRAVGCGSSGRSLERRARDELGQRDSAVLEALGVLGSDDEQAERRLIDRRLRQLRAVERLQALVEREIEEAG